MKAITRIILYSVSFFLILQLVYTYQVRAETIVTKTPVEDGTWDNSGRYTDLPENYVGYDNDFQFGIQQSAIKFDFTEVQDPIRNATLRIYIQSVQPYHGSYVSLYGSIIDDWEPWYAKILLHPDDPLIYDKLPILHANTWQSFDVTSFVRSQSDKIATFVLRGEEYIPGVMFTYYSRNFSNQTLRPELILQTSPVSSNADLIGLGVLADFSPVTLSPAFNSDTTSYTLNVDNTVSQLIINPTIADFGATVKVNGIKLLAGQPILPTFLNVGNNGITIEVTAENGATKTYTITAVRAAPKYTVSYNGNGNTGGSVPMDNGSYEQGASVYVKGNTGGLVKDGHRFEGWSLTSDDANPNYKENDIFIMENANVTFLAKWLKLTNAATPTI
ncbi:cadherin-like beta sandwich domain-containing protein, partial [Lysinibacillus sp. UBA6686]